MNSLDPGEIHRGRRITDHRLGRRNIDMQLAVPPYSITCRAPLAHRLLMMMNRLRSRRIVFVCSCHFGQLPDTGI
jgi:hypothetical protein